MAKQVNKTVQRPAQQPMRRPAPASKSKPEYQTEPPFVPDPRVPAWLYSFKVQAIVVALLAIILYADTFNHEYALDDTIVIAKNEYVYEGFAGLKDIFTRDAFDSYYKQFNSSNQLAGGRYRPLSIATFAIEQQFMGPLPAGKVVDSVVAHAGELGKQEDTFIKQMHVRHVFNVFWYALSVIAVLYFLRYVVFKNPLIAFMTAIIFTVHPLHTEVVANVKSRDEILSMLFISLTFIFTFKYEENRDKKWLLVAGLASYALAFLAKEYAVGLVFLLPLALYLFRGYNLSQIVKALWPYMVVMVLYMLMRSTIVAPMNKDSEADILNNPYALASDPEKLATKISTTMNYLKLLIFPHPLSADYSYNSIPYKDFTSPLVWLSLIVHGVMIRYFFYYFKRRHVMSFAIAFYIINILLICNLIFNIGGTMGERLCYHSSLGFAMAVAFFLYKGMEKIKSEAAGRLALAGCMLLIVGLCSFKTIDRARYWKNDKTLFFEDIKVQPNSVLVNADVASSYVNGAELEKDKTKWEADVREGIKYFSKAIEINPAFVSGYLNRGTAYFKLKQPDSAYYNLMKVKELYPRYPKLDELLFNVGVNFYLQQRYQQAVNAWSNALQLNPQNPQALNAMQVLKNQGIIR